MEFIKNDSYGDSGAGVAFVQMESGKIGRISAQLQHRRSGRLEPFEITGISKVERTVTKSAAEWHRRKCRIGYDGRCGESNLITPQEAGNREDGEKREHRRARWNWGEVSDPVKHE